MSQDDDGSGFVYPDPDSDSESESERIEYPETEPPTDESSDESTIGLWIRDGSLGFGIVIVGLLLLTVAAGVWPPMTVVESGSMEPNINQGDMTIVSAPDRFVNEFADENGVVTHDFAVQEDIENLGGYGTVIVFQDPQTNGPATIHRAMFHVEEGEDWFERANESFLHGATSCSELRNCPAPNAGYITKGDNNPYYDQAIGLSRPIDGDWISSVARADVPYVGWIRLIFSGRLIV